MMKPRAMTKKASTKKEDKTKMMRGGMAKDKTKMMRGGAVKPKMARGGKATKMMRGGGMTKKKK